VADLTTRIQELSDLLTKCSPGKRDILCKGLDIVASELIVSPDPRAQALGLSIGALSKIFRIRGKK